MSSNRIHKDPQRALREIYFAMCKSIDTPVSLGSWLRFKYGEFEQLARKSINPSDYITTDSFMVDYQVTEYLSKYKDLKIPGINRSAVALASLSEREIVNARLNADWFRETVNNLQEARIHRVSRVIDGMLGPFSFERVLPGCRWGPGSTATLKLRESYRRNKYLERGISVTRAAFPYFKRAFTEDIHWLRARGVDCDGPLCLLFPEEHMSFVEGSVICTVPKKSTTDRTIAKEPSGNLFMQFGVGDYFRRALSLKGVDLSDQGANRSAALQGMATIDLRNASNSIFIDLVRRLFSPSWARYLADIRSPSGLWPDGVWRRYEMHSSMGNGYTFELETLIFYAIAVDASLHCEAIVDIELGEQYGIRASGPFCYYSPGDRLLVYGDDIVCHPLVSGSVISYLEAFGFEVNLDKTHTVGPFRESCGIHAFNGTDVTPVYQKEVPLSLSEYYRLTNRLSRKALSAGGSHYRDQRFRAAYAASRRFYAASHLASQLDEDDGLVAFYGDEIDLRSHSRRLIFLPDSVPTSPDVDYAYTLRFIQRPPLEGLDVREWWFLDNSTQGSGTGRFITVPCRHRTLDRYAPWC